MNKAKTSQSAAHSTRPTPSASIPVRQCLPAFKRLLRQTQLNLAIKNASLGWYDRIFTPVVTLWCMIFPRLNHDHTLQAAVTDLHMGGADRLSSQQKAPLSKRIQSMATTAFSNARKRLPLALFPAVLAAQAQEIWDEARDGLWPGLRVLLLDGSQISLRPHPEIIKRFEPSANQNGKAYWALMQMVATFCLHTGVVVASTDGYRNLLRATTGRTLRHPLANRVEPALLESANESHANRVQLPRHGGKGMDGRTHGLQFNPRTDAGCSTTKRDPTRPVII